MHENYQNLKSADIVETAFHFDMSKSFIEDPGHILGHVLQNGNKGN